MSLSIFQNEQDHTATVSTSSKPVWWTAPQAGLWSDGTNWSGSAAPAANDTVRFMSGSANVNGGFSQSAISLHALYFGPGWVGKFTGSLIINGGTLVVNKRTGWVGFTGRWTNAYIINTSPDDPAVTLGGTYNSIYVLHTRGVVKIADSTKVDTIIVMGDSNVDIGDAVTDRTTGGNPTVVRVQGNSIVDAETGAVTLNVGGNAVFTTQGDATVGTGIAVGHARWGHTSSGTITAAELAGRATLELEGNTSSSVTITDLEVGGDAVADLRTGKRTVALTNPAVMYGGVIRADEGATLT